VAPKKVFCLEARKIDRRWRQSAENAPKKFVEHLMFFPTQLVHALGGVMTLQRESRAVKHGYMPHSHFVLDQENVELLKQSSIGPPWLPVTVFVILGLSSTAFGLVNSESFASLWDLMG
jgi:hypothetical protein